MEFFTLVTCVAIAVYILKLSEERRRIALLGSHLGQFQIEKLMETVTDGYLRALGEKEPERRDQVWTQLAGSELKLCEQFTRFVAGFAKVDEADARVSKLPIAIPFATRFFPGITFDMRKALAIHAQGILHAAENAAQRTPKDKAFTLSAELFLMQHSCHWFCKSKAVASARMLVRHKTSHEQLIAAVSPETRAAYTALVSR
jgi:hypothetical protein